MNIFLNIYIFISLCRFLFNSIQFSVLIYACLLFPYISISIFSIGTKSFANSIDFSPLFSLKIWPNQPPENHHNFHYHLFFSSPKVFDRNGLNHSLQPRLISCLLQHTTIRQQQHRYNKIHTKP